MRCGMIRSTTSQGQGSNDGALSLHNLSYGAACDLEGNEQVVDWYMSDGT